MRLLALLESRISGQIAGSCMPTANPTAAIAINSRAKVIPPILAAGMEARGGIPVGAHSLASWTIERQYRIDALEEQHRQ
jgi:hypothetical protein